MKIEDLEDPDLDDSQEIEKELNSEKGSRTWTKKQSKTVISELRLRVYNLVKHEVSEMHENFECDAIEMAAIEKLCDYCADDLTQPLSIFIKSSTFISNDLNLKLLYFLVRIPYLGNLAKGRFATKIYYEYRCYTVIITAL